jgi:hypothetical protein
MHEILILFALALIARAWWDFVGAKRRARRVAHAACLKEGLEFLDELALGRLRLEWSPAGPRVRRRYDFEFCAGTPDRYRGWVDMLGHVILHVELQPHPFD